MTRLNELVDGHTCARRRRRFWPFIGVGLLGAAAAALAGSPAAAVHDQAFQLDGDISDTDVNPGSPGTPTVDWVNLFDVAGTSEPTPKTMLPAGFVAAEYVRDFVPGANGPDRTTFTTGSKDTLNITPGWECARANNVTDKDDVVNAYSAAYVDPVTGETKIYMAMERFSNEGSGNVAFWLLQDPTVGCVAPAAGPSTTPFTGNHQNGDVLVVSEFTVGGTVSSINVYRWVGGAAGFLNPIAIASGADCKSEVAGDDVCATVNTSQITPPWLTETKQPGGTSNDLAVSEFFEAGLSLTDLGLADRCFAKILTDTRSSPSLTSALHDYALGNLALCDLEVTKDGDTLSKAGDGANYTITIENTGGITLFKEDISDTLLGAITIDGVDQTPHQFVTSNTCGVSLAPGASCTIAATRTVLGTDPDPLPNTVTVVYRSNPLLIGDTVTRTDSHSVNLFQPSVTIDKTGDALSKVGDGVVYTITVNNTSSADTPNLVCTVSDPTIGFTRAVTLASGASDVSTVPFTIPAGAADPFLNTATVTCSPTGFPNVLTASDGHSVNLFQPSVTIDKTGDTLSKIGDDVVYTITVNNTSSADTPNLVCTVSDPTIGFTRAVTLASGASDVSTVPFTIPAGAADPFLNTATVTCSPTGFPNVLTASDGHSVNLFQPAIAVDKTGDTLSKVGDDVSYTFTLSNNSSADTPALDCTATDSLLGVVFDDVLPLGNTVIPATRTVLAGDPDPLNNTVTLVCGVTGFTNVLQAADSHSVNLFQPAIVVDKTGDTLSKVGDDVSYTFTLSNNSSADTPALDCTATDSLLGVVFDDVLPLGNTVIPATRTVLAGDPDPLNNTVTLVCGVTGFTNVLQAADSHSVNLFQPAIAVDKTGDTLSKVGDDVSYTFTLSNNSSADTPALDCTATDSLLGVVFDDVLPLGNTVIPATRTVLAGDPDPLNNTVTLVCGVTGFTNVLQAADSHSVNLFQPAIAVDKTGDTLSKVGDDVSYTFTLSNNSSADTPALDCTATDSLLGVVFDDVLPLGNTVIPATRTVLAGDPDPLNNTVTLVCGVTGFTNVLQAADSHSVDLVHPALMVAKECAPATVSPGATINYECTISNTGDVGLDVISIVDSLKGDLTDPANFTSTTCGPSLDAVPPAPSPTRSSHRPHPVC